MIYMYKYIELNNSNYKAPLVNFIDFVRVLVFPVGSLNFITKAQIPFWKQCAGEQLATAMSAQSLNWLHEQMFT